MNYNIDKQIIDEVMEREYQGGQTVQFVKHL